MRHLTRLKQPDILAQKAQEWTDTFMASDKLRPDNSKYAHRTIVADLQAMSFHKCFYCESKLKNIPKEIDHFIEVAERRDLAYEWTNLYLACTNCNDKFPNKKIAVTEVLNPCKDSDEEIQKHLTFEDEFIFAKDNSEKGLKTIQKFRLDTELLDHLRTKKLLLFYKLLYQIKQKPKEEQFNIIAEFAQRDKSYSLLFTLFIKKIRK